MSGLLKGAPDSKGIWGIINFETGDVYGSLPTELNPAKVAKAAEKAKKKRRLPDNTSGDKGAEGPQTGGAGAPAEEEQEN